MVRYMEIALLSDQRSNETGKALLFLLGTAPGETSYPVSVTCQLEYEIHAQLAVF